jgi:hypothetical protein
MLQRCNNQRAFLLFKNFVTCSGFLLLICVMIIEKSRGIKQRR